VQLNGRARRLRSQNEDDAYHESAEEGQVDHLRDLVRFFL
jgi:hypothetical protein